MTPHAPPAPCLTPGCSNLVTRGGRCSSCRPESYEASRPSARRRGYTTRWQRVREAHLALEPWCRYCGEGEAWATDVDHVIPHRMVDWLMWSQANHQSLCSLHHKRKSGQEAHLNLDELYPLDLPRPRRPVTVVCGPTIDYSGELDVIDGNRLSHSDRNDRLRRKLVRDRAGELVVIVAAPRFAERAFWSHVLETTAILTLPQHYGIPADWWREYAVDAEALDRIDAVRVLERLDPMTASTPD